MKFLYYNKLPWHITYNITDSDGHAVLEVIRTVIVEDTVSPMVILQGDNPAFVELGSEYIDAGYECIDDYDGIIEMEFDLDIDTSTLGEQEQLFYCEDSSGNEAGDGDDIFRVVHIVDSTVDNDGDNLSDWIEDFAPNSGDANDDGTQDSQQSDVTSLVNDVTNEYVSLDVTSGTTSCNITGFSVISEESLPNPDPEADYPVGLNDFVLDCGEIGATMDIKIYYGLYI